MALDPELANSEQEVKRALLVVNSLPPAKRAIGSTHPTASKIKHEREECCKSQVCDQERQIYHICVQEKGLDTMGKK